MRPMAHTKTKVFSFQYITFSKFSHVLFKYFPTKENKFKFHFLRHSLF